MSTTEFSSFHSYKHTRIHTLKYDILSEVICDEALQIPLDEHIDHNFKWDSFVMTNADRLLVRIPSEMHFSEENQLEMTFSRKM